MPQSNLSLSLERKQQGMEHEHKKRRRDWYGSGRRPSATATLDRAEELLEDIRSKARPAAERELDEIRAFAKESGAPEAETGLMQWDIGFWAERLREAKYELKEEDLRPYFQLPAVIDGMFDLAGKLFDIKVGAVQAEHRLTLGFEDVSGLSTREKCLNALKKQRLQKLPLPFSCPLHQGCSRGRRGGGVAQGRALLQGAGQVGQPAPRLLLPRSLHSPGGEARRGVDGRRGGSLHRNGGGGFLVRV